MPEEPNKRAQLERYAHAFNTSELLKYLSGHLTFSEAGDRVLVRVDPVLPTHRGGMGTAAVNGGVLAATFDFVIGITAALVDPTPSSGTGTPPRRGSTAPAAPPSSPPRRSRIPKERSARAPPGWCG